MEKLVCVFICLSILMACNGSSESIPEDKTLEQDSVELVSEDEEPSLKSQLKGTVFEKFYELETLKETGMLWRLQFVFDLHSADCGAPDCYAHHFQLVVPPHILKNKSGSFVYHLNLKGDCLPEEEKFERSGNMELYEAKADYLIFYDQQSHLLLLLSSEDVYLYEGLMLAVLDSKAPYDYLMDILEDPEHDLYPYQSRRVVAE